MRDSPHAPFSSADGQKNEEGRPCDEQFPRCSKKSTADFEIPFGEIVECTRI